MRTDVISARIQQIDKQLARYDDKKEQFRRYLDTLPKGDPARAEQESVYKNNGRDELCELLHEKVKLAYIANPAEMKAIRVDDLQPLIGRDLKNEILAIVDEFESQYGKATAATCSIARCVSCVACPSTCAAACSTCVHCPPNGVLQK